MHKESLKDERRPVGMYVCMYVGVCIHHQPTYLTHPYPNLPTYLPTNLPTCAARTFLAACLTPALIMEEERGAGKSS